MHVQIFIINIHVLNKHYKLLLFGGVRFEPRAMNLQNRHSTAWATPLVHFALVILEMESWKLFA
jgi:hypothetical protein